MKLFKNAALIILAVMFFMVHSPAPAISAESVTASKHDEITEHQPELLSTPPKDMAKAGGTGDDASTAKTVGWVILGLLAVVGIAAIAGGGGGGGGGDDDTGEITVNW